MTDQQAASSSVNLFGHGQGGEAERDLHDDAASSSVDVEALKKRHVTRHGEGCDSPDHCLFLTVLAALERAQQEKVEDDELYRRCNERWLQAEARLKDAQQEIAERDKEIELLKDEQEVVEV